MSATTAGLPASPPDLGPARASRRLHSLPVRIMHWTNALAMLVMIGSGWEPSRVWGIEARTI